MQNNWIENFIRGQEQKIVYQSEDGLLLCGDCLEIMQTWEDGCVDLVLTDPPYGIDGGRGGDSYAYGKAKYTGDFHDDESYIRDVVVVAIQEALRIAARVVCTTGHRHLRLYPKWDDMGCFWTPASATHGPWGFNSFAPILYYGRDPRAGIGAWPSGMRLTEAAEKNGHPCPKPLGAWSWLVRKASGTPGEIILDPFCGSGTTCVAAKKLGRRFVGIDISPEYCQIARERLKSCDTGVPVKEARQGQQALFE